MKFPVTQKMLEEWAGPRIFSQGQALYDRGGVLKVEYEHPFVRGELAYGNRTIKSQFELISKLADNQCPCRDSTERGIICSHVVAMGLCLIRRQTDPERGHKANEELRRAARLADISDDEYIQRHEPGTLGSYPARLRLTLHRNWTAIDPIVLKCEVEHNKKCELIDHISTDLPLAFSKQDRNLLFVLEDICEGPARGEIKVSLRDFFNILDLHTGIPMYMEGQKESLTINAVPMESVLRMDLDPESGELILMVHTELPFMDKDKLPVYLTSEKRGWIFDANQLWPLKALLPGPLQSVYQQPVRIERESVPRFLKTELPLIESHMRVHTVIHPDLLTIEAAQPRFRLSLKGSPASLSGTLYALYGKRQFIAGRPDANGQFALPDPDDILRYLVRNPEREQDALAFLARTGLTGTRGDDLEPIVGMREVLNFLGGALPRLRRHGWKVDLTGRIEPIMAKMSFATPVVHVDHPEGENWTEIGFTYESTEGESLSAAEIQRALMRGESYLKKGETTILLDSDAIDSARSVFEDCSSTESDKAGHFRLNNIYSAYVQSSLSALDGIDVECPQEWQRGAEKQNRGQALHPEVLSGNLDQVLRPYQKDGVYWLRFLECSAFGGILADEMGLGKTLQVLAWLGLSRFNPDLDGMPSLIVCPTSLVDNWAAEAEKFTPDLRVLTLQGTDRQQRFKRIPKHDLVITSYALMRRDIEILRESSFAAIILDEAQHIKNRSTQNAVSAKRLQAPHRFVLTGTPVENSVADLWSIMDFLMPGYLNNHRLFRERYELPIANGGTEAHDAQSRLRRKLHPFLLRRLKKNVAKDLPPKIERVAGCKLTVDQQKVYKELVDSSRRRLSDMVEKNGFQRSRMEILKTLLRLRQTCCHLELLKMPGLKSKFPSGKMDLFFELLDEALDGGHRVLVFSQFTSMLAIIRRELEARQRKYCYLDGSTKNRLNMVRKFNTDRSIPVFLISLKAGGTGLNLTGADMVIHFDPWWNPAVENQATDRAYRIGQKRTVYSIKLITRGTVEDKVLALQKRKKAVIDATLANDDKFVEKMTWEDVRDLLTLEN